MKKLVETNKVIMKCKNQLKKNANNANLYGTLTASTNHNQFIQTQTIQNTKILNLSSTIKKPIKSEST